MTWGGCYNRVTDGTLGEERSCRKKGGGKAKQPEGVSATRKALGRFDAARCDSTPVPFSACVLDN